MAEKSENPKCEDCGVYHPKYYHVINGQCRRCGNFKKESVCPFCRTLTYKEQQTFLNKQTTIK